MTIRKMDILYPISSLDGKRKETFIKSLKSINRSLYNICIIDTGEVPTMVSPDLFDKYQHTYVKQTLFNKSMTINIGVRDLVESDLFIICDADIIFLDNMEKLRQSVEGYYFARPSILVDIEGKYEIEHSFGAGKCFVTNQRTFNMIGGFDQKYKGYGFEDTDFAANYYILTKEPYKLIETSAIHVHYMKEDNLNFNMNNSGYNRNRDYYEDKFEKYIPYLDTVHDEIRRRKN